MTTEDTQFTVGKTTFYQGENGTHPLFRIEPGIPCRDAREHSSELMGFVRELTITGLMDDAECRASRLLCRSGLVSRKGRRAAPGFKHRGKKCGGCFAALSRHKAAPTGSVYS